MTLEQLQTELDALLDPMDVPGTPRERETYESTRRDLAARIRTVRSAQETLTEVTPLIAEFTKWQADLTGWRKALADELLALHHNDVRQHTLRISIQMIDRGRRVAEGSGYDVENSRLGQLMVESGYVASPSVDGAIPQLPWAGSLPVIEQRLRELTRRRDEAQRQLDAILISVSV